MQTRKRNLSNRLPVSGVLFLVVMGLATWFRYRESQRNATPAPTETAAADTTALVVTRPPKPVPSGAPSSRLQEFAARLNAAPDAKVARSHLEELRARLAAMSTNEAVAEIRRVLDLRTDASTRLSFKVAAGGELEDAPTLRTFLLDALGRLDPVAGAEYAKAILTTKDSADEWAVALRNLERGDASAEGRALLKEKTEELLRHAPWQENPSVGYLEAFDVTVYLGGTSLLPALSDLVRRQDNPAVAHASFLAMDRLVINSPATTLAALQAAPDLMQGRELTRANFFARADVRDPQQKTVLENYFLDPRLSNAELETFAGLYPNANYMVSNNLLTRTGTPDRDTLVQRDRRALQTVEEWLADSRFITRKPQLQKIQQRLEGFIRQSEAPERN